MSLKGKKVLFLGFSVTNDPISFVEELAKTHAESVGIGSISRIAIGGITPVILRYLLDECMVEEFDVVVLEVATSDARTIFRNDKAEYAASIVALIAKLIAFGKIPVLLDLPRADVDYSCDWLTRYHLLIADQIGVGRIDCTEIATSDELKDRYLRDVVHPTHAGAALYASKIAERLFESSSSATISTGLAEMSEQFSCVRASDSTAASQKKSSFAARCYATDVVEIPAGEKVLFNLPPGRLLRGITYVMGPRSGPINVSTSSANYQLQTYDSYCYYSRLHGSTFGPVECNSAFIEQLAWVPTVPLRKGEVDLAPRLGQIGHLLLDLDGDYRSKVGAILGSHVL